ncbi:alkaline phosphatase family protein [Plantactinospora siamensis]|uniref:Alkaline phosphatase family protein n=1 Tax=Plantactinospora siamensis TaxID=555372 RepID=A0ABV6NV88_9ACTN
MTGARRRAAAGALLGLLLAAAGCQAGGSTGPTGPATPAASATETGGAPGGGTGAPAPSRPPGSAPPRHVVVVFFENKPAARVVGNPDAPYLTALAGRSAAYTNAHGVTHPSQPNYLALFSGSTQGVRSDRCPLRLGDRPNLARQLLDAGHTFTGYAEGLPAPGFTGCVSGRYAAKHAPWVDFANLPPELGQPYTAWPADLDRLPTVAFLSPGLCNDMHDCSVATGDRWARERLAPYVEWAQIHDSLLVVTFDEDDGHAGNQILTLVAGAGVRPGRYAERVDHYSVLRTIEDLYGLPRLGAAATAPALPGVRG